MDQLHSGPFEVCEEVEEVDNTHDDVNDD